MADSSLLWKITNGTSDPSYLFGTIHICDLTIFRIPRNVFKRVDACNVFAMEMDGTGLSYTEMMERMTTSNPEETLEKLLSPESYALLMALPGVQGKEDIVNRYKPFFITSLILSDYAEERVSSVDTELLSYAKAEGKLVVGLETFNSQMDVVDSIPLKEQARMIEEALLQNTSPKEALQKMMCLYRDQDFEAMGQSMQLMSPSPMFVEAIQDHRNVEMADRIDELIRVDKQTVFAAVGALHLPDVGEVKGMVRLLQEKNYTLKAVPVNLNVE